MVFDLLQTMVLRSCEMQIGLSGLCRSMEQAAEVESGSLAHCRIAAHTQEVGAADDFIERTVTRLCQTPAHLAGHEPEIIHHPFGAPREFATQFRILRGDSLRAVVGVAYACHAAPQHYERSCAEPIFFRSEHSADQHIMRTLELPVGLKTEFAAKIINHESLLYLGQTDFHRHSRMFHRTCRRSPRAPVATAYQYLVGLGLGHTRSDGAHAAFSHELDTDLCCRVDVFQVEYELCQVFD